MPNATDVETAADLWRTLPAGSLARRYVGLLGKAAKHGVTVGALPETVEATALSALVVKDGHRAGSTTYRLHPNLLADPK